MRRGIMANKKKLVVTPLTKTIWWATVNEAKHIIVGNNKVDVTDDAIEAVLDHFMLDDAFKNKGFSGCVYDKNDGGTLSLCAYDERYVVVKKELFDELKKYKEENERTKQVIVDSVCRVLDEGVELNICDCGNELVPNHYVDEVKGRVFGVICTCCGYEKWDKDGE